MFVGFISINAQTSDSLSQLTMFQTVDELPAESNVVKTLYNYPNPFKSQTTICYSTPVEGNVSLKVYDAHGNSIITLVKGNKAAGTYEVPFNSDNLAPGTYYYELKVGKYREIESCVVE